ncbi:hypothetical protein, partial [Williamsia deligens]
GAGQDNAGYSGTKPASDSAATTDAASVLARVRVGDGAAWMEAGGALSAAIAADTASGQDFAYVALVGYVQSRRRTYLVRADSRGTVVDAAPRLTVVRPRGGAKPPPIDLPTPLFIANASATGFDLRVQSGAYSVTDNGDGTFTISTPSSSTALADNGDGTYTLTA